MFKKAIIKGVIGFKMLQVTFDKILVFILKFDKSYHFILFNQS